MARGTAWSTTPSPSRNSHPHLGGWRGFQNSRRTPLIPAAMTCRKPHSPPRAAAHWEQRGDQARRRHAPLIPTPSHSSSSACWELLSCAPTLQPQTRPRELQLTNFIYLLGFVLSLTADGDGEGWRKAAHPATAALSLTAPGGTHTSPIPPCLSEDQELCPSPRAVLQLTPQRLRSAAQPSAVLTSCKAPRAKGSVTYISRCSLKPDPFAI